MIPKIVANSQVKNEEKWVWFSLMSVINHLDLTLIWDTGSTDQTVDIIRHIRHPRLKFRIGPPTANETDLSQVRTQMLQATSADWLMILDGDEVWPDASITLVREFINHEGHTYDSIITPTINLLGDVYHASPPDAGRYHLLNLIGHYNIRFINLRRVPGLYVSNPPGQLLSYYDASKTKVQDRDPQRIKFLPAPYLHMTHLDRSSTRQHDTAVFWRAAKKKYELGLRLPSDFKYPSSFYFPLPPQVSSPWAHRSLTYQFHALWQTPLRLFKRRVLKL